MGGELGVWTREVECLHPFSGASSYPIPSSTVGLDDEGAVIRVSTCALSDEGRGEVDLHEKQ